MLNDRERQNVRYWNDFCDHLRSPGSRLQFRTSRREYYIKSEIERNCGVDYRMMVRKVIKTIPGEISVEFCIIGGPNARTFFDALMKQQAKIEEEFGESLQWREKGPRGEQRLRLKKANVNPADETDWPNQHEWLATKLEKLDEVFRPRIAEFNVNLDEVDFNIFIIDEAQPSLISSEPEEEEQEVPEGEHRYFVYAWRWCGDERFAKIGRTRNGLKGVQNRMVTTYHPTDDPVLLGVRECADAEESHKIERYILNGLERPRPDREWVEIDEKFNEMIDKSFMKSQAD